MRNVTVTKLGLWKRAMLLILLSSLIAVVIASWLTRRQEVVLAGGRVSLTIPMRYVLPHRFFWIDWGQGLDSSSRSINVLLPDEEASQLLPEFPEAITAVLALLNERERDAIRLRDVAEATRIREAAQLSSAALHAEPDLIRGLYRIYADHRRIEWTVIAGEPAKATADDVVGRCLELMDGRYRHCYLQLDIDGIGVEYALDVRNLDRREAMAKHFAGLINRWKTDQQVGLPDAETME